jgi:hypothetical protein
VDEHRSVFLIEDIGANNDAEIGPDSEKVSIKR